MQSLVMQLQVLAAAASNVAVDNLVERLRAAQPKLDVVRVGHPARLLPEVGLCTCIVILSGHLHL